MKKEMIFGFCGVWKRKRLKPSPLQSDQLFHTKLKDLSQHFKQNTQK
jgi:cytochrome c551/c552